MSVFVGLRRLVAVLSLLLLSQNALADTQWKQECLSAVASTVGADSEGWSWSAVFPKFEYKGDTYIPLSINVLVSGVVKKGAKFSAVEATCQFPIVAPYNKRKMNTPLPAEAVGALKSHSVVSKVTVSTPWKGTKAGRLHTIHREFGDELDDLFGDTVDEGSFDADVIMRGKIPAVDCAPRVGRESGELKLICKFEVKVVPTEDFGERRETECTIRFSESKDRLLLGEATFERNEDEAAECLENVGSGD